MKRHPLTLIIGLVLFVLFGLLLFLFQVRQTEVAVVTVFGKPTRNITEPGAYFKWPWPIEKVYRFDRRIQNFESKHEQTLTADHFSLVVMTYAGWTISDPKIFFPKFGANIDRAENALAEIIRSTQHAVVTRHPFSHFVSTEASELRFSLIETQILERVQNQCRANNYGIEVPFLGIKRLGLPESVTQLVFESMKSERENLVKRIESESMREAEEIRAKANLESARVLAQADATATSIRSEGEAAAFQYYQVFEQNPDLANFLLSLSGLESILKDRTTFILDQNTPPLNLLHVQKPEEKPPSGTK